MQRMYDLSYVLNKHFREQKRTMCVSCTIKYQANRQSLHLCYSYQHKCSDTFLRSRRFMFILSVVSFLTGLLPEPGFCTSVAAVGFEPTTSPIQTEYASRLHHATICNSLYMNIHNL